MLRLPSFPIAGKVPITVSVTNGLNSGGAQNVAVTFAGVCIFDETAKTIRGGDGIDIRLSGIAIIDGDIAPGIEKITGYVKIGFSSGLHKINSGRRIRDFSGNVHHTELELI